jgi:hypothetical protein
LPQTLSIWFNDPLGLLSDSLNRDVLPTYTVTGKHTQQTLQNTYWNLVNKGISFDRVKDNNLRNWLEQNDRLQHYLQRVHDATREQGLMTLRKKGMNKTTDYLGRLFFSNLRRICCLQIPQTFSWHQYQSYKM